MIGHLMQAGFPDLFCYHRTYGLRLVEVKNPTAYKFQPSQMEFFQELAAVGCGVWVLTGSSEDDLKKLLKPPNWHLYISGFKGAL